mmetsp:Transcript_27281/g.38577  ORF Transcript_27281/g.38577 Transcript_27281/m.38577 type:complete len:182 (-) Transcript_27281:970-1515(-)
MFYAAGLLPNFWCCMLEHAIYVKNRLYHRSIDNVPHTEFFNRKVNLSHLRTFGASITSHNPGKRRAKLDNHMYDDIYLGHTVTAFIIKYYNVHTGRFKESDNFTFDEAHFHSPKKSLGPALLYQLGLAVPEPSSTEAAPTFAHYPPMPKLLPLPDPFHPLPLAETVATPSMPLLAAAASLT